MPDVPDLSAELDAAEDIVMGRVSAVETEWGVRWQEGGLEQIDAYGSDEAGARRGAAGVYKRLDGALVRRTVTYGEWETVADA